MKKKLWISPEERIEVDVHIFDHFALVEMPLDGGVFIVRIEFRKKVRMNGFVLWDLDEVKHVFDTKEPRPDDWMPFPAQILISSGVIEEARGLVEDAYEETK